MGMMNRMDRQERARAEDRLRLVELVEAALGRRAEIFEIVDSSEDVEQASQRIRELFGVQEPDLSRAILDLRVSGWTRSERRMLSEQAEELRRLLGE